MDRSQYLVQALQSMGEAPQSQGPGGPSTMQLASALKARNAWTQQNPGQSYVMHNLEQAGQNLMQAPGNVMTGLRGLASRIPGVG